MPFRRPPRLALCVVLLLAPALLAATPIYVRTDGSDVLCNGTADAGAAAAPNCAVASLQQAVALVDPAGVIQVRNGTYLKSNTAVTKPVTIEGESRAGVVIGPDLQDDHSNSGLGGTVSSGFVVQSSDVTLRHLTIDGDANPGLPGAQNFRNGVVTDFRIAGASYDRTVVEDVSFANIYRRGYYILARTPGDPAGAYLSTGNVIRDSSFTGVGTILQHRDASGAVVLLESSALVENNTVTASANGVLSNYLTTPAVAPLVTARGNTFSVTNTAFNVSGLADGSQIGGPGPADGNVVTLAGALSVPEGQNGVGVLVQYATGSVLVQGNVVNGSATDAGAWLYQNNSPVQPVVLRGNRLLASSSLSAGPGQGVGVLVTDDPALFGESGSGPSYATLESNDVSGFVRGVSLWRNGPAGGSPVEATLAFNRLVANGTGLENNDAGFVTPAEENWWGCSYGPGAVGAGCAGPANATVGSVDADPWLTLTVGAAPAGPVLVPAGTYTVTASLRVDSGTVVTGPPYLPPGVPVAFTTSLAGSSYVAPPGALTDSQASATLGSNAPGSTSACGVVDAQTACVSRDFAAEADLSVALADSADPVALSAAFSYAVDVANAGPSDASGVTAALTLPGEVSFVSAGGTGWSCGEAGGVVSCSRASLAVGSAPTISVNVTAPVTPGPLSATAAVSSATPDPTAANDSDTEATTVSTATPIYVRTDGSDALCDGTADAAAAAAPACAVATLQKANTNVSPNGQILVRDGLYFQSNTTLTKPVTLEGQSRAGVILGPALQDSNVDNSFGGAVVSNALVVQSAGVTVRHLTIDGSADGGLPGEYNFRNGVITDYQVPGGAFHDVVVEDVSFAKIWRRGYYVLSASGLTAGHAIRNCSFDDVGQTPNAGAMVFLESSGVAEDNVVTGSYAGVLSNYLTTAANAPALTVRRNQIEVRGVGMNLSGLDDSVIGGPAASDGNTLTLTGGAALGFVVQWTVGQVELRHNTLSADGASAGLWVYRASDPAQPVLIEQNRFSSTASSASATGESVGVLLTDDPVLFGEGGGGPTYATLTSNDLTGFQKGVQLWRNAPSGGHPVESTVTFNRIVGNVTGLDSNYAPFVVPAEDNWWGCSYGPGASGADCSSAANGVSGSVDAEPWLTLTTSAPAGPWTVPGPQPVTASLRVDSTPAPTGPPYLPSGIPVAFTSSLAGSGYLAPPATLADGLATADLASTTIGSTQACAQVDAQSSCLSRDFISNADLQVSKTDGSANAVPGQPVTYTITVANLGPQDAPGTSISDVVAAPLSGCTWTCVGSGAACPAPFGSGSIAALADLPAGSSLVYTLACALPTSATGSVTNTASASAGPFVVDPNAANDSATDTDTLTPTADVAVSKTDGTATAIPGQGLTYIVVASNPGPSDAPGTTVADAFPAGLACNWTCGASGAVCPAPAGTGDISATLDLPAGAVAAWAASCQVSPALTGTLSNTANVSVSAGVSDPDPGDNSATDVDTVVPTADLAVTKDDGLGTAVPGQATTYTITVTNAGPSTASGASVTDTLPSGVGSASWTCSASAGATCSASGSGGITDTVNLPPGGSAAYTLVAQLASSATGTLSNTASVAMAAGGVDPDTSNNSATDSDTLVPSVDLSVSLTDAADPVPVYGTLSYTASLSNAGPSDGSATTLALTLPAGTTFVSSTPGSPVCGHAAGVLTCNLAGLAASDSTSVDVTASADAGTIGTVNATAQVSGPEGDPDAGNNTEGEATLVKFVKGDQQNDLSTDLYLRDTVGNQHVIWLMDGVTRLQEAPFNPAAPASASQQVVGVDDFDGDYRNDLVFWDSATGAVEFWLMNGLDRVGAPVPISGAPTLAPNWKLSATADFNHDGQPDIVWRNFSSQKIVIWTMNGTSKVGNVIPTPDQAVDPNWEIVAAQDLNADGNTDFLWYNYSSGKIVYWWMDASVVRVTGAFTNPANAGDANWKVLAGGDYGVGAGGLAGTNDIVWRNETSGNYVVWYMDNAGNRTFGTFTVPPAPAGTPTDWTIVGPR